MFFMLSSGTEGEAGEAAGCPGRPVPSQRGETEGAAEAQGGGERKEEEGGRRGGQVSSLFPHLHRNVFEDRRWFLNRCLHHRQAKLEEERREQEQREQEKREEEEARQRKLLEEQMAKQREEEEERQAKARLRAAQEKAQEEERKRREEREVEERKKRDLEEETRRKEEEEAQQRRKEEQEGGRQLTTYRALYSFVARNADELSIDADGLIEVRLTQTMILPPPCFSEKPLKLNIFNVKLKF